MTQMNVGRNSPCPCGSGKKFKHCCLKNAQNEAIGDFLHGDHDFPCLLCNGPSAIPSVFAPSEDDYKRLGVPVNKIRVIFYALCYNCYALPNKSDLIEQKVMDTRHLSPHINIGEDPIYEHDMN